ncbi:MAG: HAD-IC family P-type ATPase, partial [Lachnospiraceae bacterium]|nr:HAD-IC family P-type ATPase [Lachnospiraceae bacterium]
LFKTASSMEETGRAQIVALDKTGTITSGITKVTDIVPAEGVTEEQLLKAAYALENESEHPLARAVVARAEEIGTALTQVTGFEALPGHGIRGVIDGRQVMAGNRGLIFEGIEGNESFLKKAEELAEQGRTPLFFREEDRLLGLIAVADTIKEDSARAIEHMHEMGLKVVMITGDNEKTARAIGASAGVDDVIAGVFPEGKETEIRKLKEQGKTVMIGDGINAAPALTRADVGIAIGAGTDVAIDAADVVLMKGSLVDAANAIKIGRKTITNIHQNLFWAFIYNIIGIPLAAGVFTNWLGWSMNPMFGAAAMSLSSFCVVSNALRLNAIKLWKAAEVPVDNKETKEITEPVKEEVKMEKVIRVDGMMCMHCEAIVQKAVEALDFVESAKADHESGTVTLVCSAEPDMAAVQKAVEDQDYVFVG